MKQIFKKKLKREFWQKIRRYGFIKYASISFSRTFQKERKKYQNALIPIDNVLHSSWSGSDITMNGELVSTTNQKYMYKSYFETVLNNSHSTKQHQLKMSGFFGDSRNKDINFMQNCHIP